MGGCASAPRREDGELVGQDLDSISASISKTVLTNGSTSFNASNWGGATWMEANQHHVDLIDSHHGDDLPAALPFSPREPPSPSLKPKRSILRNTSLLRGKLSSNSSVRSKSSSQGSARRRSVSFRDRQGNNVQVEECITGNERDGTEHRLSIRLSRPPSVRSNASSNGKTRHPKILFDDAVEVIEVDDISKEDRFVEATWANLTKADKLFIRKELNELKTEMEVHQSSRHNTRFHPDGPVFPQFVGREGCRVRVRGYDCPGTLRFYGPHKTRPGPRCGVELDEPRGLNDGRVNGHRYFTCPTMHGLLCNPSKVQLIDDDLADE
eukprot:TRINITY_DN8646_c0_g1_i4.p1 TRINITY_DN8646_c0_g1~~TRINITY_DN8646_c0_g1_i4.p1  ORF type:complete len:324 (+),score=66.65 TRINITY_DN8646_c0_g1_i4:92-1063(+)